MNFREYITEAVSSSDITSKIKGISDAQAKIISKNTDLTLGFDKLAVTKGPGKLFGAGSKMDLSTPVFVRDDGVVFVVEFDMIGNPTTKIEKDGSVEKMKGSFTKIRPWMGEKDHTWIIYYHDGYSK